MSTFVDAFVFPIAKEFLTEYQAVANQVAQIWLEHGALSYQEFIGADLQFPGTRSFSEVLELSADETAVLGWSVFETKAKRDAALKAVSQDSRMAKIVGPLMQPDRLVFDAERMIFGGFTSLITAQK